MKAKNLINTIRAKLNIRPVRRWVCGSCSLNSIENYPCQYGQNRMLCKKPVA